MLCGAVLLLTTACGTDGHGYGPRQLGEMIAESVRDSADTGLPGLGTSGSLYDPGDFACAPAVDPRVPGDWRGQAPRVALEPGEPAEIGLSDATGDPITCDGFEVGRDPPSLSVAGSGRPKKLPT